MKIQETAPAVVLAFVGARSRHAQSPITKKMNATTCLWRQHQTAVLAGSAGWIFGCGQGARREGAARWPDSVCPEREMLMFRQVVEEHLLVYLFRRRASDFPGETIKA